MELVDAIFGLIGFGRLIVELFALLVKGLVALLDWLVSAGRGSRPRQERRSRAGTRKCLLCGTRSFTFEIQVAGGCPGCGRKMVGWFLPSSGRDADEETTPAQTASESDPGTG